VKHKMNSLESITDLNRGSDEFKKSYHSRMLHYLNKNMNLYLLCSQKSPLHIYVRPDIDYYCIYRSMSMVFMQVKLNPNNETRVNSRSEVFKYAITVSGTISY
jgi:hypothetical protein